MNSHDLEVRREANPDYDQIAKLAAAAFDLPQSSFDPQRLDWLYTRAFHYGSTIFSLFSGPTKVGQVVLVHQRLRIGSETADVLALFDLFITKAYRSRDAIGLLYRAVENFCKAEAYRFIIGVPNESGARVNIRYLKLSPVRRLDIRLGIALPRRSSKVIISQRVSTLARSEAVPMFEKYLPPKGVGMQWTGESVWDRLSRDQAPYSLHATKNVMLVSSIRRTRGVSHTLLCGFFARDAVQVSAGEITSVIAAACLLHRRPLYLYAGCHDGLPLPGFQLPDRLRPSPLTVQWRDFAEPAIPIQLQRFELLDFDFA